MSTGSIPMTGGRVSTALQAAIVTASFAMLLAGTNAINPLLPVYRDVLGLDAFVLSLTYSLYVAALVVVLFTLSRPRFARHAVTLLLVSLATMIASDLMVANAAEWSILAGRIVAGIAGGLGTGAVSALVVAAIGAGGRGVTATANTAGGVLGVIGSQFVVASLVDEAPRVVFLGHAAIIGLLLIASAVVLWWRRAQNRTALVLVVPAGRAKARFDRFVLGMLASGAIAWGMMTIAVVFGATMFADLGQPVVRAVGPALLLASCAAAQLCSPGIARIAPWVSGSIIAAFGVACVLGGAWLVLDPLAIVGFAFVGAGAGIAYRTGLVRLTRGVDPARQGALASLYAAGTYAVAALIVLLIGILGNVVGLIPIIVWTLATIGVLALAALFWAPRLRDTMDLREPPVDTASIATPA